MDVVLEQHELAGSEPRVDSARRVGKEQITNPEGGEGADRKGDGLHRMAFVKMTASAQNHELGSGQPPHQYFAGMARYRRGREAGQLAVGHAGFDGEFVEHLTKPAAQDKS